MADNYNGWTNRETWMVNLWMSNERGDYSYWTDRAEEALARARNEENCDLDETRDDAVRDLADDLESQYAVMAEERFGELEGFWADVIGTFLNRVDWREIAEHWIDDVDEEPRLAAATIAEHITATVAALEAAKPAEPKPPANDGDVETGPLEPDLSRVYRVLVKRPDEPPEAVIMTRPTLDFLQAQVGGYIECVALTPRIDLWCNEEGHLNELPPNVFVEQGIGVVVGTIVIAAHNDEGATIGLSDADLIKWGARLHTGSIPRLPREPK